MLKLPPKLAYQENFTIRTYETGQKKEATVSHLLKLMHESAMQNVIALKVSVWDLEAHKISWVLRHMQLQVNRLPRLGETINVLTYPAGFERLFTYRDYRVVDSKGQEIATAASKWLLMNTENRRLAPIPDHIAQIKMPAPEDCLPRPNGKLPNWTQSHGQQKFQVNWHDLDFNGHLNNVVYLNWMLEPLPEEVLQNSQMEKLDILYRAEGIWKEEVLAEIQQLGDLEFLHRLIRIGDGKELAAAKSIWKVA